MKKLNISRFICIGGILTAFTVLFQLSPVFFPAIGLFLSPLSTLPIAIATVSNIPLGIAVFITSALLLAIINIQELLILLFTTGLLGLVIGILLLRKGILISILFSSIALSLGMIFLTYVVSIPAFVDFTSSLSISYTYLMFFLFSLIYASIWNFYLKKYVHRFLR